jgi:hypothetical protein
MLVKNASAGLALRSLRAVGAQVAKGRASRPDPAAGRGERPLLRVAGSFFLHLPEMLVKRVRIRSRARVSDHEIERWLYQRPRWDARSE